MRSEARLSFLAIALMTVAAAGVEARQTPKPVAGGFGQGAHRPGPGVTPPTLLQHTAAVPAYTLEAARAGVEGTIDVEVVVARTGKVADARITKPLDAQFGLDDAVMRAVRLWQYFPAEAESQKVDAIVTVSLAFALGPGPSRASANRPLPRATWTIAGALLDKISIGIPPSPWKNPANANLPRSGPGLMDPVLIKQTEPNYTVDAMRHKVQGKVELEVVVHADGTVGEVRVVKSLDAFYGLDDEATKAAEHWIFRPGTVAGQPVDCVVVLELTFRVG